MTCANPHNSLSHRIRSAERYCIVLFSACAVLIQQSGEKKLCGCNKRESVGVGGRMGLGLGDKILPQTQTQAWGNLQIYALFRTTILDLVTPMS